MISNNEKVIDLGGMRSTRYAIVCSNVEQSLGKIG